MKKLVFTIILLIANTLAMAQNNTKKKKPVNICEPATYVHASLGGGIHNLCYDLGSYGTKGIGLGGMFTGGISHFFTDNFGATAGIMLNYANTSAKINTMESIENAIDEESKPYTHRTYFFDLKENQSIFSVGLPIGGIYQHEIGKKFKITASAGVMVSITLSGSYKTKSGYLETRGYYPEYKLEMFGMEQHHQYTAKDFNGYFDLKPSISPFLQVGGVYCINKEWSATAGIYFAYGANSVAKSPKEDLYNPDCMSADAYRNPAYNGVCSSPAANKINTLSVGIMVGAAYNIGNIFKKKKPQPKPLEIDIINVPDSALVANVDDSELNIIEPEPFAAVEPVSDDNQPVDTQVVIIDVKKELSLNGFNMQFAFNDSTAILNTRYQNYLDQIAEDMKENPEKIIIITGHTCDIGSYDANYKVALRRAGFAKQQLMQRGISANRIKTQSKAYLEPLVPNTSEENRKINRRIEFKYDK
ncbi:MAG: OmpA family protein [Bacteroidales bacterium]|nr:OmpA family protein [Bacteroidales bacterium]